MPALMSILCSPHWLACPMRRAKGRVLGFLWSEIQKGQDSSQRLRQTRSGTSSVRAALERCLGGVHTRGRLAGTFLSCGRCKEIPLEVSQAIFPFGLSVSHAFE